MINNNFNYLVANLSKFEWTQKKSVTTLIVTTIIMIALLCFVLYRYYPIGGGKQIVTYGFDEPDGFKVISKGGFDFEKVVKNTPNSYFENEIGRGRCDIYYNLQGTYGVLGSKDSLCDPVKKNLLKLIEKNCKRIQTSINFDMVNNVNFDRINGILHPTLRALEHRSTSDLNRFKLLYLNN